MITIVYIISDINKSLAFEWVATDLDKKKFDLRFILLNPKPSQLEDFLKEKSIPVERIICKGKLSWLFGWWKIYRILRKWKPDIDHCNLQQHSYWL